MLTEEYFVWFLASAHPRFHCTEQPTILPRHSIQNTHYVCIRMRKWNLGYWVNARSHGERNALLLNFRTNTGIIEIDQFYNWFVVGSCHFLYPSDLMFDNPIELHVRPMVSWFITQMSYASDRIIHIWINTYWICQNITPVGATILFFWKPAIQDHISCLTLKSWVQEYHSPSHWQLQVCHRWWIDLCKHSP